MSFKFNPFVSNFDYFQNVISTGDTRYLKLDQTTPQQIINGLVEYDSAHPDFTDGHQIVDKEYVDEAVARIGARFYMLDVADGTVATYKQTSMTASALATASVSASVNAVTDTLIEEWISPSGMVWTSLSSGVYDLNVFCEKTAGNRTVRVFWRFYERQSDGTEILIATSTLGDIVTAKERFRIYATLTTDYTPAAGSRLVGKVYFNTVGGSQNTTCVLYYQGVEDSHWQIPVSQEFLDDNYVTYTGATKDINLGTKKLETAGTLQAGLINVDDASTIIDKDGSGNMTFTDIVAGTRTLKQLGCPTLVKLSATGQSAGSLNLTGFGVSKVWLKSLSVKLESGTSTDFDIEIYEKDTFLAADKIPADALMSNDSDSDFTLDILYDDLDASDELHIKITDNDRTGSPVWSIKVKGIELI